MHVNFLIFSSAHSHNAWAANIANNGFLYKHNMTHLHGRDHFSTFDPFCVSKVLPCNYSSVCKAGSSLTWLTGLIANFCRLAQWYSSMHLTESIAIDDHSCLLIQFVILFIHISSSFHQSQDLFQIAQVANDVTHHGGLILSLCSIVVIKMYCLPSFLSEHALQLTIVQALVVDLKHKGCCQII